MRKQKIVLITGQKVEFLLIFRCDYESKSKVMSVRPSLRPSVPCYFRTTNIAVFEGNNSSNDVIIDGTMSDDEVVVSDVPPRYLFTDEAGRVSLSRVLFL